MSTTKQLSDAYRQQINSEFKKAKYQFDSKTKGGRRMALNYLSKLSKKVHDRGRITLKIEGMV